MGPDDEALQTKPAFTSTGAVFAAERLVFDGPLQAWTDMTRIRLVAEWTVDFGDEQNADWVPEGTVLSLPGGSARADVGLVVLEEDPATFLLEWHGPTAETSGHSRHPSLEAALEQADQQFGIPADAWFEARGDGAED